MADKTLNKENILHLGKLANLELNDEEVARFQTQLGETLKYVENLHELDTKAVQPTNHTTNLKNITFEDGTPNTRKLTQEEALQNAKESKNGYFFVKRIMGASDES